MANILVPQNVDFLPAEYREQHATRRRVARQTVLGALLVAALASAGGAQAWWRQHVRRQLDEVVPQYNLAMARNEELGKLQAELQVAQAEAQLITYLRHPWPCTQLLRAMVAPLPDSVAFRELKIGRENLKVDAPPTPSPDRQTLEQQLAKMPRAARDLKALREQFDRTAMMMNLSGVSTDSRAVYQYLRELGANRLVAKVDLVSLDNATDRTEDRLEFKLHVLARPGYGQSDGPKASPPVVTTATKPAPGGSP